MFDVSDATRAMKELTASIGEVKDALQGLISDNALKSATKRTTDSMKEQLSGFSGLFKGGGLLKAGMFGLISKGTQMFTTGILKDSVDMIERQNLFAVSLGRTVDQYGNLNSAASQYYTDAVAFQDRLHEKFKTNEAEMQAFQGQFYNMFKAQMGNIDISKYMDPAELLNESLGGYSRTSNISLSEFLSEQTTKMAVDMASLFNLSQQQMAQKLMSGISGQIETLRTNGLGIDISEASLQKVLDSLGVQKKVTELSYAEKELARYISILRQAGVAQGDFARTMDQPANQIRVFKAQVAELKQVVGSLFIGIGSSILKYVIAVVQVIKTVLSAIGKLFGVNFNMGVDTATGAADTIADSYDNVGDSIGGASAKAAEFKKQLMSFDEIHNIEPPSKSSGGGGRRWSAAVLET